jgi:Phasin protein
LLVRVVRSTRACRLLPLSSKKAFEDGTHAFGQMLGAKSFEQAFEIQSQYAMKAYNNYIVSIYAAGFAR